MVLLAALSLFINANKPAVVTESVVHGSKAEGVCVPEDADKAHPKSENDRFGLRRDSLSQENDRRLPPSPAPVRC